MGSCFGAKIKRHNGFILEELIHQYVFLHGYKKYFKMKQNKIVKTLMLFFSLDHEGLIQVLLEKIILCSAQGGLFSFCVEGL